MKGLKVITMTFAKKKELFQEALQHSYQTCGTRLYDKGKYRYDIRENLNGTEDLYRIRRDLLGTTAVLDPENWEYVITRIQRGIYDDTMEHGR